MLPLRAGPVSFKRLLGGFQGWLYEIPPIPVQILEYRDRAIRLDPRLFHEPHPAPPHLLEIAPKIVGLQEREHPAPRLITDARHLNRRGRSRKQAASPLRT